MRQCGARHQRLCLPDHLLHAAHAQRGQRRLWPGAGQAGRQRKEGNSGCEAGQCAGVSVCSLIVVGMLSGVATLCTGLERSGCAMPVEAQRYSSFHHLAHVKAIMSGIHAKGSNAASSPAWLLTWLCGCIQRPCVGLLRAFVAQALTACLEILDHD